MTDPARPQPVLDAAKLGGLIQVAFVAVCGAVFLIVHGLTTDNLLSVGTAIGGAATAVVALVVYMVSLFQGHAAAAQVTPLQSPQDYQGRPLVPVEDYGKHAAELEVVTSRMGQVSDEHPTRAQSSPRVGAPTFRLGRLPNDPSKPRVRLTALEAPSLAYSPPVAVDWYSKVPASSWGMDGNDAVSDCTVAEVDHCVKALQLAAGNPEVGSTPAEVLAAYSAITGYKASDPNSDRGAMMQDVRNYWRKNGITLGGQKHTILLFAQVDHTDHALIKWCIARFGELGLGFAFPDSAMDQFNAGQPWTVVKGTPAPTEGHAVGAVGYDDQYVYVVTWGRVQKMAWAFFDKYVDEAWAQLSEEFVSATSGDDPLAETAYQLGQQYAAVTGQPNPIPAPIPAPTPSPRPPLPAIPADWVTWARHALTLKGQSHLATQVAREIIAAAGQ